MKAWFRRMFGGNSAAAGSGASPSAAPPPGDSPSHIRSLPPDDFTQARKAGREMLGLVMQALKDERGIHLESLYCALGALAGRACQDSVRAQALAAGQPADALFEVATTVDGRRWYFGDALNRPLAEDRVSVWSLVAGAAAHAGAARLPDLNEMFRHSAEALGSESFGLPRLPPEHPVHARPVDYADRLWPSVRPVLDEFAGEPKKWPVAVALAIQDLMAQARGQVPPDMVARIVMESAIPVSKIPIGD